LDPDRPTASAIAIEDGTISAVGSDAEVRAVCDGWTEQIDGHRMAIVPGLVDAHQHPFLGAESTQGVDLSGVRSLDELRTTLAGERLRCDPDGWIRGWGLHYEVFRETGIHGATIENAVVGQPTMLVFYDYHTALASPAALAAARITGPVVLEGNSTVVCIDDTPTGELKESGAMALVRQAIPEPTAEERYGWYVAALRRMNALGLTGLHGMDGTPATFDLLRRLEERDDLTLNMVTPLWQDPTTTREEMEAQLPLRNARGRTWRGGVAKFFIDGVIESGTAWLDEPDTRREGLAPYWPSAEAYMDAVSLFARAGFQCATHAIGDRAVRCALDAYRAAGAAPGIRHRIEHVEQLQDRDLPRFAAERVTASMQPLHTAGIEPDGSDEWSRRLGSERCRRTFRWGDLLRSGATLAFGSDWPVASFDPRPGMALARLRRPAGVDRAPVLPDQALSALDTLAAYTIGPAAAVGEDHVCGRLRPGYRADLTAFGEDPVDCPADDLPALPVLLTVVAGRVVHRAD
ncbi:MAG: amidohydrolase, partial [Candidatus Rokuibacteriota bacterium]